MTISSFDRVISQRCARRLAHNQPHDRLTLTAADEISGARDAEPTSGLFC